uniref:Malonyl-CoA decarboxylase n=2 Tax=Acrobeloides nanus TaxID=290746 RepID=A0A914EB94_9BILA
MGANERSEVISFLSKDYAVDHEKIKNAITKYEKNQQAFPDLTIATKPHYYDLLKSIGNLSNGVKFVCDFRADLLQEIKSKSEDLLPLRRLDNTAKDLLTLWFCNSNLRLERLTWKSPADILQKVAQKEAVHPVHGLIDMQRRVGPCRRCFVFMHESMPREPLVIVHVALMDKIADNLQDIIKRVQISAEDEEQANTAIYYSISSTQQGLSGIDLGNMLIKNVVLELQKETPQIHQHSTLSPIPGFRSWLIRVLKGHSEFGEVIDDKTIQLAQTETNITNSNDLKNLLLNEIESNNVPNFQNLTLHLCAKYLHQAKNASGYALNPVANFHLRNGAQMYRLNWGCDLSARGIQKSLGIMVNYKYNLEKVPTNSARYINGKYIDAHEQVINLL